MRALILGGTGEARALASKLVQAGWHVTSSLAGRVSEPKLPEGNVRIGGFGGPAGLAKWLLADATEVIIDATHPFAERISESAAEAARATGIPLVALHRPAWDEVRGDQWLHVANMQEAAELVRRRFRAPFLTIGRQQLAHFADDREGRYLIRSVETPSGPLPRNRRIVLSRGPFDVPSERKIMRDYAVDCVVTKNSGGPQTYAKIEAARDLKKPVVIVDRPALPGADIATVTHTVDDAFDYIRRNFM
ncbi:MULTISPECIES: cobalt-precorrin-6A reductase [unclassified Corynebacterium]|uniref:cobalt-precorrin-6A reductase n=1 Tax=unclassified Corynebacterium TaxID=2624378 RepID=UPI003096546B